MIYRTASQISIKAVSRQISPCQFVFCAARSHKTGVLFDLVLAIEVHQNLEPKIDIHSNPHATDQRTYPNSGKQLYQSIVAAL